MNSRETRKRKITDFFNSQLDPDKLKAPSSSSNSPLADLKCPKKKVFEDKDLHSSSLHKKENRRSLKIKDHEKSQRVLDCGQAKIGNVVCEECGMVYCVDSPEDTSRHSLHHNRYRDTAAFKIKPPAFRILEICAHKNINSHHIFHVGKSSPNGLRKAVEDWMILINEAIGYCVESDLWSAERRLFLSVSKDADSDHFVSGILVIEKLSQAITEDTKQPVKEEAQDDWIVGVERIWTHQGYRKTGIGSSLLDAATMLDRAMEYRKRRLRIAFSELSSEGKVFAKKFVNTRYLPDEDFGSQLLLY